MYACVFVCVCVFVCSHAPAAFQVDEHVGVQLCVDVWVFVLHCVCAVEVKT